MDLNFTPDACQTWMKVLNNGLFMLISISIATINKPLKKQFFLNVFSNQATLEMHIITQ